MKKNISKIFNKNLTKNFKTVTLKPKMRTDIGNMKYLPSFSKEWRNIIYSFNKNNLKNIPINDINSNKLIKSYFNLFFKDHNHIGLTKFLRLKRRRNFLRRIYVSNVEIKHTNQKAKITLYTINREKQILRKKHNRILKLVNQFFLTKFKYLYQKFLQEFSLLKNPKKIYTISQDVVLKKKSFFGGSTTSVNINEIIKKSSYIKYKLQILQIFLILNRLYLEKTWSIIVKNQYLYFVRLLKKNDFLYSLNQFKFNNKGLLPKLSKLLWKIIGNTPKKIQYNIVNLKSIAFNTDIFTNIVALNIKKKKNKRPAWSMLGVLNKARLPKENSIQARMKINSIDNLDFFKNKFKDLKLVSNINNNLDELLSNSLVTSTRNTSVNTITSVKSSSHTQAETTHTKNNKLDNSILIKNSIFNSIRYKNMGGIRLEVKGRLTKRYRADRAIYSLRWKGGLKNIDSSFKELSSVLFRGNTNSNVSYSIAKSKRRIGAFAVKGWIAGK